MADISKLGKYEIRGELGRGAMGVVYEGFDPIIERIVAIKTIRAEQFDRSQVADLLARFKREAQAAGRLNHPHIVGIYEYGEDNGVAFIAMEYIKGRELKDYFEENRRFPMKEVERIMTEMLDALEHAHSHGVTHRDMKPANVILLDGTAAVKVADFGIARIETSELTQAGTVLGTPAYMSPEQFLGQTVDRRSDLFSCGVILYQFLTGEKPFTGAVTTIMHKVLKEEPLPPSTLNATLPAAWDSVVKKVMAKNPDDRYQSAREFGEAIRAVISGKGAGSAADATVINLGSADATVVNAPEATLVNATVANPPPAKPAAPAPAAAAAPSPQPAQTPAAPPAAKKSNAPVFAAIAAGVLVIAAGGYLVLGKKDQAADQSAAAGAPATAAATPAAVPAAAPVAAPAPNDPGLITISALGLADPARFNGDAAAAGNEARADAKRQLVEKALALYVTSDSLNKNYEWVSSKLLAHSGDFIKTTLSEDAPQTGKDGLVAINTTATVKVRDLQKSLNEMSQQERVDFIRNNGDPKIAVAIQIVNAEGGERLPPARSQLAENVVKERIKSFGFRTWANDGDTKTAANAQSPDFQILGEVKVKTMSITLPASGLKMSKTALTSWTVKAVDRATGEEIYSNTTLPQGDSFNTEDQALSSIGKMVGDEFSKNFFLAHFNFRPQKTKLNISGLPDGASPVVLRELRSMRAVLDAKETAPGKYELTLPEGSGPEMIAEAVLKPLNAKLGQSCFTSAGSAGDSVNVAFAAACAGDAVRGKLENTPPAGLLAGPDARSKAVRKTTT
ncbi:MAG TPA: serine/threonine-protein kinase [Burkholderiales bacterium]|nr:serine/threonine-protein kinase [Burkholderiales bacterium]